MKRKFLGEDDVIDFHDIEPNVLNLITTNCGSGKSTFCFNSFFKQTSNNRCLYLIDTTIGQEQIIKNFPEACKYGNDIAERFYEDEDEEAEFEEQKVIVMTYSKFGYICMKNPAFQNRFAYIVADEFHNCLKFLDIDKARVRKQYPKIADGLLSEDKNIKKRSYDRLNNILADTSSYYNALSTIKKITYGLCFYNAWIPCKKDRYVMAISATPERIFKDYEFIMNEIEASCEVFAYENKKVIEYNSLREVLQTIENDEKGIIFAKQIKKILEIEKMCNSLKLKTICLWSVNNKDYPMSKTQLEVRDYIIKNEKIPEEYDVLLLNKAYETSFNIKSKVDYIIIHDGEKDFQIQARGRYRGDIDTLFCYLSPCKKENSQNFIMPEDFLDIELDSSLKKELAKRIKILNKNGDNIGWSKIKSLLTENGYTIKECRKENKRISIISKNA